MAHTPATLRAMHCGRTGSALAYANGCLQFHPLLTLRVVIGRFAVVMCRFAGVMCRSAVVMAIPMLPFCQCTGLIGRASRRCRETLRFHP
jgi:hypothetical protein